MGASELIYYPYWCLEKGYALYGHEIDDTIHALEAGLGWRDVAMVRAFARYLQQIQVTFTQDYIAATLQTIMDVKVNKDSLGTLTALGREVNVKEVRTQVLVIQAKGHAGSK